MKTGAWGVSDPKEAENDRSGSTKTVHSPDDTYPGDSLGNIVGVRGGFSPGPNCSNSLVIYLYQRAEPSVPVPKLSLVGGFYNRSCRKRF